MALTVAWIFDFGEHLLLTIPCLTRLTHHLSINLSIYLSTYLDTDLLAHL
jgi:hypothetical protein